ncbi:hypothetical protein Leryth_012591 [Lithospermum erythrorhizon]|uniref:Lipase n=1 Tax=Lithospermum erythrorhizon TaxID=34254 RepID=A0AAV3RWW9_LITER|nr:hypothetical protein Leryth_012591 [Lithospermum erythrorhizon]
MATATMATAAGAAALLYYTLNKKLQSSLSREEDDESVTNVANEVQLGINRVSHRLIQAPVTWLETISTLSETLRFTYSETLGKWPIADLAFGINFLWKRQGNLHVASIFGGSDSVQLKGSAIVGELKYLLELLTLCWHFSKKSFPIFLEETGYSQENVLLHEPKAGILKPAFTILINHEAKSFLLLIRGTHSIKDTLTAVTGAVVPFHHTVVHEGGVSNLVLGYAHCGMVAAARWIAKLATPCLLKALSEYPDYKLKIVGHSLGGGTAALLTYVLREQKELAAATCVSFAPAACMTWELAESGNEFITSVINGADLVPTFSAASVDDLRAEVTASAWLNDLRNQIERTRVLSTVYRSASALGSRLPSIATARAKVAGAGAILSPVSDGTQVVMKRAQTMARAAWSRPSLTLASWSCIGPRLRSHPSKVNADDDVLTPEQVSEPFITATEVETTATETGEFPVSSAEAMIWNSENVRDEITEESVMDNLVDNEDLTDHDRLEDRMTEVELWQQLEHELYDEGDAEETDVIKEIRDEEAAIAKMSENQPGGSVPDTKEAHRFFPPGKVMHIITDFSEEIHQEGDNGETSDTADNSYPTEENVGMFLTPRSLYSKIRLSKTMISDHYMPVYRRKIEKIIKELEAEGSSEVLESNKKPDHGIS